MRFSKLYQSSVPQFSVEVYPPKTQDGVEKLITQLKKIEEIKPAYISVTYGALGSTRDLTKDLAFRLYEEIQSHTAFHFTCVGMGRDDIKAYVDALYDKGVNLVLALRGDIPKGENRFKPPRDGFYYASELVAYLKTLHDFSVAVAGYPEKHPEAVSLDADIDNLKRKVDAGAEVILTQLFFNNQVFYEWLNRVRQKGISIPVVPGIMPILKLSQVQKITDMCGASLPEGLVRKLKACGDDAQAMREVGVEHALQQSQDLLAQQVPGIHYYCLNQAYSVLKIIKSL